MLARRRKFHTKKRTEGAASKASAALAALCLMALSSSGCQREHPLDRPVTELVQGKVSLGVIHHLGEGTSRAEEEGGALLLQGAHHEVELTEFAIVVADVEVHACTRRGEQRAGLGWEAWPSLVTPSVWAHVPESATRLGTPTVEDLLSEPARARILGEVAPPAGEYCKIRLVLAGADEDVVNLSAVDTTRLLGKSVRLRGRWKKRAAESWQAFDVSSERPSIWEIDLSQEPISLTKEKSGAFVLVDKPIAGNLADTLAEHLEQDPQSPRAADAAARYLQEQSTRYAPAKRSSSSRPKEQTKP